MSADTVYVGIDIAKATLAVRLLSQDLEYPNTPAGHTELCTALRQLASPVQVICEATGGYERALVLALHAVGIALSVVNPRQVRDYARARGLLSKTDKIDAGVLADYGERLHPAPTDAPTAGQLALAGLVTARQDLVELISAEKGRAEHLELPLLRRQHQARLRQLDKQRDALDQEITRRIKADELFAAKSARLQQVDGVGPVLAMTLIALMPELGHLSDPQAAALAGVAPFARDSGPYKGQRHISGGRAPVRRVLYMAALSASSNNRILSAHYLQLIARGKLPKVALTAIMRKLIILLNRLLADPAFALAS